MPRNKSWACFTVIDHQLYVDAYYEFHLFDRLNHLKDDQHLYVNDYSDDHRDDQYAHVNEYSDDHIHGDNNDDDIPTGADRGSLQSWQTVR